MTLLRFDFCYYIRYSGNHTTLVLKMSTSLWMSAAVFVVQVARPPSVCDVTSAQYGGGGASRDGKILATTAIQEAIEACATDGGGLVVFPGPGIYLSGALTLRSNVHIHVDPTATLLGSDKRRNIHLYPHWNLTTRVMELVLLFPRCWVART